MEAGIDQDLRNRVNFLEGEVTALETIMAEMVAVIVSSRLIDADLLKRIIDERITRFTVRQHDDLILGTPGEHYFKGAIQVLDEVMKELSR